MLECVPARTFPRFQDHYKEPLRAAQVVCYDARAYPDRKLCPQLARFDGTAGFRSPGPGAGVRGLGRAAK